jgi:hypothetical protein
MMSELALDVTDEPRATDLDFIGKSLSDFNHGDVGPSDRMPLAVFLRDDSGTIVAGISGYTAWGWLYVQWRKQKRAVAVATELTSTPSIRMLFTPISEPATSLSAICRTSRQGARGPSCTRCWAPLLPSLASPPRRS